MAILKCKMCGGDLNIAADEKIIECEYCGSTQTIPDGSDEKKTNLFNRANRLRMSLTKHREFMRVLLRNFLMKQKAIGDSVFVSSVLSM